MTAQPLTAEELAARIICSDDGTRCSAYKVQGCAPGNCRLDLSTLCKTDAWSTARKILAQAAQPPTVQGVDREKLAEVIYNNFFGGTSDPTLDENAQGMAFSIADDIIAAFPGLIPAHPVTTEGTASGRLQFATELQKHLGLFGSTAKAAALDITNSLIECGVLSVVTTGPDVVAVKYPDPFRIQKFKIALWESKIGHDEIKVFNEMHAAHIAASYRISDLEREVLRLKEPTAPGAGWLPIALCPTDGVWRLCKLPDGREVLASFDGVGLLAKKRWQTKIFFMHNPSRATVDERSGITHHSVPYDSYIIADLKEGTYPTHFRPNDTVYGKPEPPAPAPEADDPSMTHAAAP